MITHIMEHDIKKENIDQSENEAYKVSIKL